MHMKVSNVQDRNKGKYRSLDSKVDFSVSSMDNFQKTASSIHSCPTIVMNQAGQ
jgi:hypothetical protein